MVWGCALAVITLLALIPLGILVCYDENGPGAWLTVAFVKVQLYPAKKKKKSKKAGKEAATEDSTFERKKTIRKGGSFTDFFSLLDNVLSLLIDLHKKLRVDNLELRIIMAGGDPCDLAINYGKAWALLGNIMPRLEQFFHIKKRNLEVECDFLGSQTLIAGKLHITITLGRLLAMGLVHGSRVLMKFLTIMNRRKGGAKQHE